MNAPIVSAEAKGRFAEAVKNYMPPAPEKYRALNEVKDSIIALREGKSDQCGSDGASVRVLAEFAGSFSFFDQLFKISAVLAICFGQGAANSLSK
jgi:hypothetical protein